MAEYELGSRVWTCSHGPGTIVRLQDKDNVFHVYVDTYGHIGTYSVNNISPLSEYVIKSAYQKAFDIMKPLRDHVESIECDNNCMKCPLRYGSNTCIAVIINDLFECRFD